MKKGFTLIEVVLVVSILGIFASFLTLFSYGLKNKKELDFSINLIAALVRDAQQKSITQEEMKKWGVYLEVSDNVSGFALFKDVPINIYNKYTLSPSLKFDTVGWTNLIPGTCPMNCYKEINFSPVDGLPLPLGGPDVIIKVQINNDVSSAKTIIVSNNGTITY